MDTEIRPGDRISILGQDGREVKTGAVLSAHNYGTNEAPDWYIELNDDRTGYEYYKQCFDGGSVVKLAKPRMTVFDHVNHSADRELVTDAVYEAVSLLLEIPGVRDAVTVAAVKAWGDVPVRRIHNRMVADDLKDLPREWAYQYLTSAEEA